MLFPGPDTAERTSAPRLGSQIGLAISAPLATPAPRSTPDFPSQMQILKQTAPQILKRLDWCKIPRFASDVTARDAKGKAGANESDRKIEKKQLDWMKAHRIMPTP